MRSGLGAHSGLRTDRAAEEAAVRRGQDLRDSRTKKNHQQASPLPTHILTYFSSQNFQIEISSPYATHLELRFDPGSIYFHSPVNYTYASS